MRRAVVSVRQLTPRVAPTGGSGFLVRQDGLVYTNRHVIEPEDDDLTGTPLYVGVPRTNDLDTLDYFPAEIVFSSPHKDGPDFAVLKIAPTEDEKPFPTLPTAIDELNLGASVSVLGYPANSNGTPVLSYNTGYHLSHTRTP